MTVTPASPGARPRRRGLQHTRRRPRLACRPPRGTSSVSPGPTALARRRWSTPVIGTARGTGGTPAKGPRTARQRAAAASCSPARNAVYGERLAAPGRCARAAGARVDPAVCRAAHRIAPAAGKFQLLQVWACLSAPADLSLSTSQRRTWTRTRRHPSKKCCVPRTSWSGASSR